MQRASRTDAISWMIEGEFVDPDQRGWYKLSILEWLMDTRAVSGNRFPHLQAAAIRLIFLSSLVPFFVLIGPSPPVRAQAPFRTPQAQQDQTLQNNVDARAEAELQTGIALTSQGHFEEAIPHFLSARGRVSNEFALEFDLALCYAGTSQSKKAIPILNRLRREGRGTQDVYNLLSQAYIGDAQPKEAFDAFQLAAALSPRNEKLYLLVAQAAMDHQYYALGVDVVSLGLKHLPRSSRLFYERGALHTFMNEPNLARQDLEQASKLAPGSKISHLAGAQKGLMDGNIPEAIGSAREGIQQDPDDYVLLTILGMALIRSGASLGQADFAEAQTVLEKALSVRPNFATAQLALGQVFLMAGRLDDAIAHLGAARELAPENTSVYSNLAKAYQRQGKMSAAQEMLTILDKLNREQAATYKSAPPDQKASYLGSAPKRGTDKPPQK